MATILIVDDEKDILGALEDTLVAENFNVVCADTGKKGLKLVKENKIDLILLDLHLPDMDGYDICRFIKNNPSTASIPILILSTRSKEIEKVVGLEIGADDYVTKPYNDLELLARIRAALRRTIGLIPDSSHISISFTVGPVSFNLGSRQVIVENEILNLTRKEFDLLAVLIQKPGEVFSRTDLLNLVWGQSLDSLQKTVDSHVKTLRKKLGTASPYIQTVSGEGYRWAEEMK